MRVQSSRFRIRSLAPAFLGLLLGLSQPACRMIQKVESKSEPEAAVQPGMFTLTPEQLTHLKTGPVGKATWAVAVHTTGTVDWDADHTTQAITQVNGPISRILVDTGTQVKQGDPLLYVASPDLSAAISTYRKAYNRQAFNKRNVERTKELLDRGAVAVKDYESSEADLNDAMTDVQNSLQALRIFGINPQEIDQAEKQGTAIATELAVRSPISGVIVQKLVSPGQVIQAGTNRLLHDERRLYRLGAGPRLRSRSAQRPHWRCRRGDQRRRWGMPSAATCPTSARSSIPIRAPHRCAS